MAARATSIGFLVLGIVMGIAGLALGAFLASGNNGWPSALLYSVVGLVCAPLSAMSWRSRRSKRLHVLAGVTLAVGLLASMGLLFDLTNEDSQIVLAWSQVPLAVAIWFAIWLGWHIAALGRLILFQAPRTRRRLSSRRGDAGH